MTYIVEVKFNDRSKWVDSGNIGLRDTTFNTMSEANEAIEEHGSDNAEYRVVPAPEKVPSLRDTLDTAIFSLSMEMPFLTADTVQARLADLGLNVGNAAGSFFKGSIDVRKVPGRSVRSKRAERKGGQISVYRSRNFVGIKPTVAQFIKGYNAKTAVAGR